MAHCPEAAHVRHVLVLREERQETVCGTKRQICHAKRTHVDKTWPNAAPYFLSTN